MDDIQTVRETLTSWPLTAQGLLTVGPAVDALARVEAVVKAAREVDAGAWGYTVDEDSASPLVELHYRLAALDPTEAPKVHGETSNAGILRYSDLPGGTTP